VTEVIGLDHVDAELRKHWDAAGRSTPTRTMTLVALCETREHVPVAERAMAHATARHGARSLLVEWCGGAEARIDARVTLRRSPRGEPCSESIHLLVHGDARTFVPDAVSRLLAPDLPALIWWVGDLPDQEVLLDRVATVARATIAIVDANAMDLRDLPVLDGLARRTAKVALADFCWQRLRTWQELMARFFDVPEAAADLEQPRALQIRFQKRARDPEPVSNQAALYAGWLATRLGLRKVDWPTESRARLVSPEGELLLDFTSVDRPGVFEGSLVDVTLHAGDGTYRVHRSEEDSGVICWEGERPNAPFPNQCVRTHVLDDGALLDRILQRPLRDPLYEASLAAAASLIADILPGAK
jgi:glucose-6-phosphate dehydrogenase assembly protein OpcA